MTAQYGLNAMSIPESNFFEIFFKHMLSPFFVFQYFSAIVWFTEEYVAYAVLILLITLVSIYVTTAEEVYNLQRLKTLAGAESTVRILETNRSAKSTNNNNSDLQFDG